MLIKTDIMLLILKHVQQHAGCNLICLCLIQFLHIAMYLSLWLIQSSIWTPSQVKPHHSSHPEMGLSCTLLFVIISAGSYIVQHWQQTNNVVFDQAVIFLLFSAPPTPETHHLQPPAQLPALICHSDQQSCLPLSSHKDTELLAKSEAMSTAVCFNCNTRKHNNPPTTPPPPSSLPTQSSQWNQPLAECTVSRTHRDSRDLTLHSLCKSCWQFCTIKASASGCHMAITID